jgi:hypothetical protein
MDAPTQAPADWRSRYGFDQGPSEASQNYWKVNGTNGNLGAQSVNQMPFVLDPAKLFGLDPAANKQAMYSQPQAGGAMGAAQGGPLQQILGMIQQNPQLAQQLMPEILKMQGGQGG